MKNRIAVKLTLYFTGLMLVFALVIGAVFYQFFKAHTVDIKKQEMQVQAQKIASVISENMNLLEQRHGDSISNSRFVSYIDNVTQEMVWVVDKNRNLSINKERMEHLRKQREKNNNRLSNGKPWPEPPATPQEAYARLPKHIKEQVENAFAGKGFVEQEYTEFFDGLVLTVGEPVRDAEGNVKAVVLLHSPVKGLNAAILDGMRILLISVLVALVLGVVLSIVLSWRFTRPLNLMKNNAERLAERDYDVRNYLMQRDEIGELGDTLDVLAERLKLADEESQKLEKLRREFIANISHELRTPVTVIRGSLEALRDGVVTEPADVKEFHEQMYNESIFLQRLINDLLDLSRLQNTDFPIEKAPLNLYDVLSDAARSSGRLGMEKNISIRFTADKKLYPLNGDYGRLRQMLLIFLHNSIKFSPAGSEILLQLEQNKVIVQDFGCGMPNEDIQHAFDRFYKARNEQNKSGSGLGLAIAKQIALRHGMQLELASEVGKGTTITILLPYAGEVHQDGAI